MPHLPRLRRAVSLIADLASICSALALCLLVLVFLVTAARVREVGPQAASRRSAVAPVDGLVTTEGSGAVHPPNARVAVVEFSDPQCPFCARYARTVYPRLKREFVDSGQVAYSVRQFPLSSLHRFAKPASEAEECANEQGRFWEMRERLFSGTRELNEAAVLDYAREAGLEVTRFDRCLADGRSAAIMRDQVEGRRLGVRATPAFAIGWVADDGTIRLHGLVQGGESYEQLRAPIAQMLSAPPIGRTGTER